MRIRALLLVAAGAHMLMAAPVVPPCITDTLADYIMLQGGCQDGDILFASFGFTFISGTPVVAGQILLTPGPSALAWTVTGAFASGSNFEIIDTLFDDPYRGMDGTLSASGGSTGTVTTVICGGVPFTQGTPPCTGLQQMLSVSFPGDPSGSISFPTLPNVLGIINEVQLNPNGGTTGSLTSKLTFDPAAPEPGTWMLCGFGLAGAYFKRRLKH